jgi:hypothetical protein
MSRPQSKELGQRCSLGSGCPRHTLCTPPRFQRSRSPRDTRTARDHQGSAVPGGTQSTRPPCEGPVGFSVERVQRRSISAKTKAPRQENG